MRNVEPHADAPDWEILKLIREVRRRVSSGDPRRFLERLGAEPRWIAALPEAEAKVAWTILEATRALARQALEARAAAPSFVDVAPAGDIPAAEIEIVELPAVDLAPVPIEDNWAPALALARKANRRRRRGEQTSASDGEQGVLFELSPGAVREP